MKTVTTVFAIFGIILFAQAQDLTWPKTLSNNNNSLTIYQPQVESWEAYEHLDFRMAFQLIPYQEKEIVGVVYLESVTTVNMKTHVVDIKYLNVVKTDFPGMKLSDTAKYNKIVKSFLSPGKTVQISLEQIVACTPKPDSSKTVKVNNKPPTIFVSTSPAILLQLEGKPMVYSASKKDSLLKLVINANWPVFYDEKSKMYFLYDDTDWQKAPKVSEDWTFTSELPESLDQLAGDSAFTDLKDAFPPADKPSKSLPKVFYEEGPAELMLFNGQPTYESVEGTSLEFATNTESALFFDTKNNQYYYLVAGRWFSSRSLNGPWVFATNNLPEDFKKIPLSSPAASVLASVPGTDEAADAVMIAQIPHTKTVDPKTAPKDVSVSYNGLPVFDTISGTSIEYAVNTNEKVVEVDNSSYYLCQDGVWYNSSSANGPWMVANTIPQEIYSIPPSSPVYNVTYVTQTTTSSGQVVATSTAGYMGAFVVGASVGAVLVMGTGYAYPPYYYHPPYGYPMCYPPPCTYGAYAYHSYPYYGGTAGTWHNSSTGAYGRSATAYSPYGARTVAQGYNPNTGTYGRGTSFSNAYGTARAGQAYNPYTGTSARGASESNAYGTVGAAQAHNQYTGASAATRQAANTQGTAGASVATDGKGNYATSAHASNSQGAVTGGRTSTGGKAVAGTGTEGSGGVAKTAGGNMYASKDGNVYRNTGNGWESNDNGNWNQVTPENSSKGQAGQSRGGNEGSFSQGSHSNTMQNMNREAQNRQSGAFQNHQFNQARSGAFANSSFGGDRFGGGGFNRGGFSGGGFRGGRR